MFNDWVRALGAIEFFKTRQYDNVVRSLRETFFRAGLDQREAKLFRAMSIEVVHFLRRMGIALPEVGPPGSPPRVPPPVDARRRRTRLRPELRERPERRSSSPPDLPSAGGASISAWSGLCYHHW